MTRGNRGTTHRRLPTRKQQDHPRNRILSLLSLPPKTFQITRKRKRNHKRWRTTRVMNQTREKTFRSNPLPSRNNFTLAPTHRSRLTPHSSSSKSAHWARGDGAESATGDSISNVGGLSKPSFPKVQRDDSLWEPRCELVSVSMDAASEAFSIVQTISYQTFLSLPAAPYQLIRRQRSHRKNVSVFVTKDDFRIQQLQKKTGSLIIFVVDASGSMAINRMAAAKG